MSQNEAIQHLQDLHRRGALGPDEYAATLAALLTGGESGLDLSQDLRLHAALECLDQEWDREREQFVVKGRYNSHFIPTRFSSLLTGAVFVTVGIGWAVLGSRMGQGLGGFNLAPIIGGIIVVAGTFASCSWYAKARAYEVAYQAYLRRRADVLQSPMSSLDQVSA